MNDCVKKIYNEGGLTKETADELNLSDDVAKAVREKAVEKARSAREKYIQSVRITQAIEKARSHPKGTAAGINALLTKDMWHQVSYENIEYLGNRYKGEYHSLMADILSRFRTRMSGLTQDKQGLEMLVRAVKGEEIPDKEIAKMAEELRDVFERARQDFNRVGGSIPKSERWDLPQQHNRRAIEKLGFEKWYDDIKDDLDWDAMLDDDGNPIPMDRREEVMQYAYETIVSDGLNKIRDVTKAPRNAKSKLSRKHSQHRFIHFRDADAWLRYAERYGSGDIFTTITDHVDALSHDVAMMEIFGPNPQTTYDALRLQAKKDGASEKALEFNNWLWNVVSGKINQSEVTSRADLFQGSRNLLTAAFLPGAFISAISDEGFKAITSSINGINPLKVFMRQLQQANPADEEARIFAVRLGLIADTWTNMAGVGNRYADVYGTGVTSKISEVVLRASWLTPYTEAGRKAFGMEFTASLADDFGKSFDQLSRKKRDAFKHYGINQEDWDAFRSQEPLDFRGAKFADVTAEGGNKFHNMILQETDFAVPTPDARVRAITTGGLQRGGWAGEAWRSAGMFKSFSITMLTTHVMRAAMRGGVADKVSYAGALLAATTIMGYVSLQAKDFVKGMNPREIENGRDGANMLLASMVQGGGLGIAGDFLFSDTSRFGGGISQTIASPLLQAGDDVYDVTFGNAKEIIKGEKEVNEVLADFSQFAKRYTPTVWQVRLVTNAAYDNLSLMADPTYQSRYNRMMSRRMNDYKQTYWAKPGRAPETPDIISELIE